MSRSTCWLGLQFIVGIGAVAIQLTLGWQIQVQGLTSGDVGTSACRNKILHRNTFGSGNDLPGNAIEVPSLTSIVAVIGFAL